MNQYKYRSLRNKEPLEPDFGEYVDKYKIPGVTNNTQLKEYLRKKVGMINTNSQQISDFFRFLEEVHKQIGHPEVEDLILFIQGSAQRLGLEKILAQVKTDKERMETEKKFTKHQKEEEDMQDVDEFGDVLHIEKDTTSYIDVVKELYLCVTLIPVLYYIILASLRVKREEETLTQMFDFIQLNSPQNIDAAYLMSCLERIEKFEPFETLYHLKAPTVQEAILSFNNMQNISLPEARNSKELES